MYKNFLFRLLSNTLRKAEKLRDKHTGEVAYIFGDGPSIKYIELEAFRGKIAIGLNYFLFHKDINKLNLDYSVITCPFYFYPIRNKASSYPGTKRCWYINRASFAYRERMRDLTETNFFINLSNLPVLGFKYNLYYLFKKSTDDSFDFFNECIENSINPYAGSLTTGITMAIYMGFSEVYLLGCDYTHEKAEEGHWYDKTYHLSLDHTGYLVDFFTIVKKYIKIFTVTIDGKSTSLDYITYAGLTGYSPIFRSHDELISTGIQKILMIEKAH